MQHFDVVVIGTGVAGQTAASDLARAGMRVAITDRREYGGTCALRGCEPKKVLFEAASAVEAARALAGRGVSKGVSLDWHELIAFKRTFTDSKPADVESWLASEGVSTLHGEARFIGPDTLEVDGAPCTFDRAIIASGATPLELAIPGADLVWDSERFMATDELPASVAFIGGGYISFEFAHIAAAAGTRSTILHRSARVLREFDADLASLLADGYRTSGVEVRVDTPVIAIRAAGDGEYEVVCGNGDVIVCGAVVHGAGRVPDLAGLDLDAAAVRYGARGIEVDDRMCAAGNERIYAAGDAAASGAPLTPVAIAQARVAAADIISPGSARFDPAVTPSVCFSHPPIASVGLGEDEAARDGLDVDVRFSDMSAWTSSRRAGDRVAGAKLVLDRESGRVLGAHLLGRHAGELIHVFALAVERGMTGEELRSVLWAYPTAASDIGYLLG